MSVLETKRAQATVKSLLTLAWPIIVSRSSQVVVGLSDALMVAHLGDRALAATTTGAMNSFVLFILPMGTVFIVGSFASQHFGKGDRAGARRYGWYGLVLAVATTVFGLVTLPLIDPALKLFEFEPELESLLLQYMMIRLFSAGAVVGMETLNAYYGGLGNTRLPMIASVAAMVLNVGGNWVLINGHLGFPALGVAGAAWASVLSTSVAFLGLLAVFLWEGKAVGAVLPKLRLAEFWKTLRFGLPSGLNWFLEFAAFMFFIDVVMAGLGTTALAGLMAVMQLNSVAFMPAFALASAGAIVTGQAIGAGHKDDVPRAVRLTFLLAGGWQTAVGLVYLTLPGLFMAPFAKGEGATELIEVGSRMLMLSAAWQLFDAAVATLAEALRAAGDTAFPLWIRVFLAWVVFVPGTWLTVRHYGGGDIAAMLWVVGYIALLALALWWRFRRGTWRKFELTEGAPA